MKAIVIVDTNVPITANGRAEQASLACQLACITTLRTIQAERRISVDLSGLILQEYRRHLSPNGQPGVGDSFFKWLWNNQANPQVCVPPSRGFGCSARRGMFWNNQANPQVCVPVQITPIADGRDFAEFPDDPALAQFDRSDRKFVAVARAHPAHPSIFNAVDTDWLNYQEALATHGVRVEHVCLNELQRLRARDD